MDFDLEIHGLKEMENNLRDLGAQMGGRTLRSALRDAAEPLEEHMIDNAPESEFERVVKTRKGQRVTIYPGFLKSRIKRRASLNAKGKNVRRFGKDGVAIVKVGVFRVPYVVQVEYGTRNVPARPFIRSAASRSGEAINIFKMRLQHRIKLAQKRLARKAARGN